MCPQSASAWGRCDRVGWLGTHEDAPTVAKRHDAIWHLSCDAAQILCLKEALNITMSIVGYDCSYDGIEWQFCLGE
jgi:hypothetical protein